MSETIDSTISNEIKLIRQKYPDRVPCIVKPKGKSLPTLTKKKFLVPQDLTLGNFTFTVRKYFERSINETESLYWFCNDKSGKPTLLSMNILMSELDRKMNNGDILIIYCASENTFGSTINNYIN